VIPLRREWHRGGQFHRGQELAITFADLGDQRGDALSFLAAYSKSGDLAGLRVPAFALADISAREVEERGHLLRPGRKHPALPIAENPAPVHGTAHPVYLRDAGLGHLCLPAQLIVAKARQQVEKGVAAVNGLAHAHQQHGRARRQPAQAFVVDDVQRVEPFHELAIDEPGDGRSIEQEHMYRYPHRLPRIEQALEILDPLRMAADGYSGA